MKKIILAIAISIFTIGCFAQVNSSSTYVNGYFKSNGTYVNGYYRTTPDNTNNNNYSTKPNENPYTGKQGTIEQDNNYCNSHSRMCIKKHYNSCRPDNSCRNRDLSVFIIILNAIALSCQVLKT